MTATTVQESDHRPASRRSPLPALAGVGALAAFAGAVVIWSPTCCAGVEDPDRGRRTRWRPRPSAPCRAPAQRLRPARPSRSSAGWPARLGRDGETARSGCCRCSAPLHLLLLTVGVRRAGRGRLVGTQVLDTGVTPTAAETALLLMQRRPPAGGPWSAPRSCSPSSRRRVPTGPRGRCGGQRGLRRRPAAAAGRLGGDLPDGALVRRRRHLALTARLTTRRDHGDAIRLAASAAFATPCLRGRSSSCDATESTRVAPVDERPAWAPRTRIAVPPPAPCRYAGPRRSGLPSRRGTAAQRSARSPRTSASAVTCTASASTYGIESLPSTGWTFRERAQECDVSRARFIAAALGPRRRSASRRRARRPAAASRAGRAIRLRPSRSRRAPPPRAPARHIAHRVGSSRGSRTGRPARSRVHAVLTSAATYDSSAAVGARSVPRARCQPVQTSATRSATVAAWARPARAERRPGGGVEHVAADRRPAGLVRGDDGDPRHHAADLRVDAGHRADAARDRREHDQPLVVVRRGRRWPPSACRRRRSAGRRWSPAGRPRAPRSSPRPPAAAARRSRGRRGGTRRSPRRRR